MIPIDKKLFELINNEWTHPFLDGFMPFITDFHTSDLLRYFILPLVVIIWIVIGRSKAFKHLIMLIVVVATTDIISHRVIKATVKRPRPEHHHDLKVNLKTHTHTGWSFTSNHAANNFAAATYLTWAYPVTWPLFFIAATVAYSRVYVGVHFPSDILGGALFGIIWALFLISLLKRKNNRRKKRKR